MPKQKTRTPNPRLKVGDVYVIGDGNGGIKSAKIDAFDQRTVAIKTRRNNRGAWSHPKEITRNAFWNAVRQAETMEPPSAA